MRCHLLRVYLALIADPHPQQRMQDVFTSHVNDSTAQLLKHQRKNNKVFSWDFLEWLVSEEENCKDTELKAQMSDLAARLVSLRRGVIPTNAKHEAVLENKSDSARLQGSDDLKRWPVQVKWRPEHELALHERAAALNVAISQRKADAVAEIIGKVNVGTVPEKEMEARMRHITAATRIVEFLATVPDREERRRLLQDATTPPTPPSAPTEAAHVQPGDRPASTPDADPGDREEDLLHTTPLQLLQAVKTRLAEVQADKPRGEEALVFSAQPSTPQTEMLRRLSELKADALQAWNDSF